MSCIKRSENLSWSPSLGSKCERKLCVRWNPPSCFYLKIKSTGLRFYIVWRLREPRTNSLLLWGRQLKTLAVNSPATQSKPNVRFKSWDISFSCFSKSGEFWFKISSAPIYLSSSAWSSLLTILSKGIPSYLHFLTIIFPKLEAAAVWTIPLCSAAPNQLEKLQFFWRLNVSEENFSKLSLWLSRRPQHRISSILTAWKLTDHPVHRKRVE